MNSSNRIKTRKKYKFIPPKKRKKREGKKAYSQLDTYKSGIKFRGCIFPPSFHPSKNKICCGARRVTPRSANSSYN